MSHIQADQLSDAAFEEELRLSLQRLKEEIRDPIPAYCYPRGVFKDKHVAMVKEAGYSLAFTTEAGTNGPASDMHLLRRTMIETLDGKFMIRAALAGRLDRYWIKELLPVRVAKNLMKRVVYS